MALSHLYRLQSEQTLWQVESRNTEQLAQPFLLRCLCTAVSAELPARHCGHWPCLSHSLWAGCGHGRHRSSLPLPSPPGQRDSSGIRLHYTASLRPYDAGIMELGLVYTPVMAIPPQEQSFVLTGYCTDKCTQLVRGPQLHPYGQNTTQPTLTLPEQKSPPQTLTTVLPADRPSLMEEDQPTEGGGPWERRGNPTQQREALTLREVGHPAKQRVPHWRM